MAHFHTLMTQSPPGESGCLPPERRPTPTNYRLLLCPTPNGSSTSQLPSSRHAMALMQSKSCEPAVLRRCISIYCNPTLVVPALAQDARTGMRSQTQPIACFASSTGDISILCRGENYLRYHQASRPRGRNLSKHCCTRKQAGEICFLLFRQ